MKVRAPAERYKHLPTERPNPSSRGIDRRSSREIVRLMNAGDAVVAAAVAAEGLRIARAVDLITASLSDGGRLFFFGAGTSGRLGIIEAAECPPTFGTPASLVRAVMAGGRSSVFKAKEGAEDDEADGFAKASALMRKGDAAVGIAASGVTPFVRGALAAAKKLGARTVLITSNASSPIREAEIIIAPKVGPEFIAGSTRLKSATAAKIVLNTLTTASFIRLGKVYDQWMVDLKATNKKLRARALRIVSHLGRVAPERAEILFEEAGRHVKTAVAMARLGLSRAAARRRLRESDGRLRAVLEGAR